MRLEKEPGFVTGVKCDLCGCEMEGDFTYYSLDVREVAVKNNQHTPGISNLPVIFSLDSCHKCVTGLGDTIRVHYTPTKTGMNCDLCGAQMRGDFTFYYVSVSAVAVNMSGGQIKCVACDRRLPGPDKPCPCGKGHPVKIASVQVDDKYLQIVACARDYTSMTDSAATIRQKGGATT